MLGNTLECGCELRLLEERIFFEFAEVALKVGLTVVILLCLTHEPDEFRIGCEAIPRETDGRCEQFRPGPTTVPAVQLPQSRDGARHTRGVMSDEAQFWNDVAIGIEIHVARRSGWRCFAKIEETRLAIDMQCGKATATEIASFRKCHGERKANGHRRIDGVAAGAQDLFGNDGGRPIWRGDGRHIGTGRDGEQKRAKEGKDRGTDELEWTHATCSHSRSRSCIMRSNRGLVTCKKARCKKTVLRARPYG